MVIQSLRKEIYERVPYVEPQGDSIEMVLIRMDAIEDAVMPGVGRSRGKRRNGCKRERAGSSNRGPRYRRKNGRNCSYFRSLFLISYRHQFLPRMSSSDGHHHSFAVG